MRSSMGGPSRRLYGGLPLPQPQRIREYGQVVRGPREGHWLRELPKPEMIKDWMRWLEQRHREFLENPRKLEHQIEGYEELLSRGAGKGSEAAVTSNRR
jgi:hypothetical protein